MDKLTVTIRDPTTLHAQMQEPDHVSATFDNIQQGSGTSDYNKLKNKPKIDGTTLEGDLPLSVFGLCRFWFGTRTQYNALPELDPLTCYCIEEGT